VSAGEKGKTLGGVLGGNSSVISRRCSRESVEHVVTSRNGEICAVVYLVVFQNREGIALAASMVAAISVGWWA
jgi:hypothetical protein